MSSWQRRMAAVDRRFSFQAALTEEPGAAPAPPGPDATAPSGPAEPPPVTLAPAPAGPSTAARLAEILRDEHTAGRRSALAGTA